MSKKRHDKQDNEHILQQDDNAEESVNIEAQEERTISR